MNVLRALVLTVALVAISGCSSPQGQESPDYSSSPADKSIGLQFEEANERYVQCMKEAGWESRETEDGTMFGFPVGQETAFAESDAKCLAQSGVNDVLEVRPDEEWLIDDGHRTVTEMWSCLVDHGFDIPDPPSKEAYAETERNWSPYLFIEETQIPAAESVCPQESF